MRRSWKHLRRAVSRGVTPVTRAGPFALLVKLGVVAAGLLVLLVGYVYVASERALHRTFEVPLPGIVVPTDSATIVEGSRFLKILGCRGCHGDRFQGRVFQDDFEARIVAPNLTRVAAEYSAGELARAIRHGVRANGEGLWQMPSVMYYHLSDANVGRMIAALRAAPRVDGGFDTEFRPGPLVRWGLMTGDWWAIPEDVRRLGPRLTEPDPADTLAYGEYLARTSCTECHGVRLTGGGRAPDLAMVSAYSFEEFRRLMQTGVALGDRELPLMSGVARGRFVHFTEAELRSLYRFLHPSTVSLEPPLR